MFGISGRLHCCKAGSKLCTVKKVKAKVSCYTPRRHRGEKKINGCTPLIYDSGIRNGWAASATHRPLYPRERKPVSVVYMYLVLPRQAIYV